MAGGALEDGDDEITGINVTPLVDVMLVLLIIFMVTTSYIVRQSIEINLPKAASGEQQANTTLEFIIDKTEALFFESKPIAYEAVAGIVLQEKSKAKDGVAPTILISADAASPHGAVIRLIDTLRKNGINDFAINVASPEAKKP